MPLPGNHHRVANRPSNGTVFFEFACDLVDSRNTNPQKPGDERHTNALRTEAVSPPTANRCGRRNGSRQAALCDRYSPATVIGDNYRLYLMTTTAFNSTGNEQLATAML